MRHLAIAPLKATGIILQFVPGIDKCCIKVFTQHSHPAPRIQSAHHPDVLKACTLNYKTSFPVHCGDQVVLKDQKKGK
jgi:hypothetical protein